MSNLLAGLPVVEDCFGADEDEYVSPRVAVLYQLKELPYLDGYRTPMKLDGYIEVGADIAYCLREQCSLTVATPKPNANPLNDADWCYADDKGSVTKAIQSGGATYIWANTTLYEAHPVFRSIAVDMYRDTVHIVANRPRTVELLEDKYFCNGLLKDKYDLPTADSHRLHVGEPEAFELLYKTPLPLVIKPIRGRDSYQVKVFHSYDEAAEHVNLLHKDSKACLLEEFLPGEEASITIMPPLVEISKMRHWALPIVVRTKHVDDVALHTATAPISGSSRVLTLEEYEGDYTYQEIEVVCETIGNYVGATAPIRIDVRRVSKEPGAPFKVFDVNFCPDLSGPGRPGRIDTSLVAMAADAFGWDYAALLGNILACAPTLGKLKDASDPDALFYYDVRNP